MAETVSIGVGDAAKIRNPTAVAGLCLATACIGFVAGFFILIFSFSGDGEAAGFVGFYVIGFALAPILMLGIYGIFWLHFVLRELRDFGIARSDARLAKIRPGWNVAVMIVLGWTLLAAIVVLVLLMRRVLHAQELVEVKGSSTPLMIALLVGGMIFYLPLFALYGVLQNGLNRVWRSHLAAATPAVSPALIETAPPASS